MKTSSGIRGYINACRHRGSRVCVDYSGNVTEFQCPYHGWKYDLEGLIKKAIASSIPSQDLKGFSLISIGVKVYQGLIFVALNPEQAVDFDVSIRPISNLLEWHGLGETKVAAVKNYPFKANWKLVVENFLECFHCWSNHPELTSVYSHPKLTGSTSKKLNSEFIFESAMWERTVRDMEDPTGGCSTFDISEDQFAVAFRMTIGEERRLLTQGKNGLAPLIGKFELYDGGETFGYFGPLLSFSLLNDHAMLIRIDPESPQKTKVQLTWLVNKDAEEGKDYDKDKLTWLWDITVKQDRTATQRAQIGNSSRFNRRGYYSELEQESEKFALWYRKKISQ